MYKILKNKPGIYSARLAKKNGGFFRAMQLILRRIKKKKIDLQLLSVVYLTNIQKKKL